jgi:hypothetical protein
MGGDLLQLGGCWLGLLFFTGLMIGLRHEGARRLRYFTLMCLALLILVQALGRTGLSQIAPEYNSENLLVLLTPLIVMFGVAFFLTLLSQISVPVLQVQFGVTLLLAALAWEPLVSTLVVKVPTISYPPYSPPGVQRICGWMEPDELMMSDIPWAVAWYGDRQCTWTTINWQYEFGSINDYVKPVHGLYLSFNTLNGHLLTDCVQGTVDSWDNFAYRTLAHNNIPDGFPLRQFPQDSSIQGLFLTDRQRW